MSRRRSFVSSLAAMQRAADRSARARARIAREYERRQREQERLRLADERERTRLFHENQQAEALSRNESLAEVVEQLKSILCDALGLDHRLPFEKLKSKLDPDGPPRPESYLPIPLGFWRGLIPGAKARHESAIRAARSRFDADVANYEDRLKQLKETVARQHAEIDNLRRGYEAGNKELVRQYFDAVIASQSFPDGWPQAFKVAYVPESKQLVLEYDFPLFEIVPGIAGYRYSKASKEITTVKRPDAERRRLYASVIAQTTLRLIYVLFSSDYASHLESMVFNGHVEAIDEATGHPVHPCLVTLRTTKPLFTALDLARVEPETCLKGLNASISRRPTELAPVKPVLEFNMVDPRFVEELDVISGLDNRTNLMRLNPREFESLITNLFGKMGLETRQTRPSRDGGVDCVAYDPRPIFGGKVVIQAKRYKNTVGVSAVRDLFGTVQNEGASKGILVTTSGYGRASFEFADGKPLELLDGSNLLYLLATHAGVEAKIEVPDDWKDPSPDSGE